MNAPDLSDLDFLRPARNICGEITIVQVTLSQPDTHAHTHPSPPPLAPCLIPFDPSRSIKMSERDRLEERNR